ncbi:hypothetical protein LX36DRAFT_180604 [Colletotrichum falcatum]|nr:hypothetical protein LX36DRAFT_180604 [Colletotrichum falcatum]
MSPSGLPRLISKVPRYSRKGITWPRRILTCYRGASSVECVKAGGTCALQNARASHHASPASRSGPGRTPAGTGKVEPDTARTKLIVATRSRAHGFAQCVASETGRPRRPGRPMPRR